jgi:hypothetical protein
MIVDCSLVYCPIGKENYKKKLAKKELSKYRADQNDRKFGGKNE